MDKEGFFFALKLIAIKQNGLLLDDFPTQICIGTFPFYTTIEQPIPKFEVQMDQNQGSPKIQSLMQFNDLTVIISHAEYVKAGYFGMSSYTFYCVKTHVLLTHYP